MIKKITSILCASILLVACSSADETKKEGNTSISGKLENSSGETVYLVDYNSKTPTNIDSAVLSETGEFKLAANVSEPGVYNLQIDKKNFCTLILSTKDKVIIGGSAKDLGNTYTVKGSKESELFYEVNTFSKTNANAKQLIGYRLDSIQQAFVGAANANPDPKNLEQLNKNIEPIVTAYKEKRQTLMDEGLNFAKKFIDDNEGRFASIIALNLLNPDTDFDYYKKVDASLKKSFPNSQNLVPFHNFIENKMLELAQFAPGTQAPEFIASSPEGKPIKLSDFKGKILLLDFWASWCGPCRSENPNVVTAYNKYKSKGLEIFAVSLDQDKQKWLDAIAKDGLTWKHASDLMGWQSQPAALYQVQSIPANFLIDKDGKIIAKNLRGAQLEEKLKQVFGN